MRFSSAAPTSRLRTSRTWRTISSGTGCCSPTRPKPKRPLPTTSSARCWNRSPSPEAAPMPTRQLEDVLKEVRRIQIVARRQVNDLLAGEYLSVFKGRGMEFDAVREYVPGDEI